MVGGVAAMKGRKGQRKGRLSLSQTQTYHLLTHMPKLCSCHKVKSENTQPYFMRGSNCRAIKCAESGTTLPGIEFQICLFCKVRIILVPISEGFLSVYMR